ncbi:MAG: dTDP-4-dehydrorhamnose 3,5-epimerase family protein [Candidatus Micrarchaeota archaeon]|nr:dTDP-4-dehydrorhamnose 3,5-epimerase family protein [Candidatus Micrarchaeota archaeon]
MIEGVQVIPLKKICDERGKIMHMMRCDDAHFTKFGEIYFSTAYPGVIKGWHYHKKMTLNYCVLRGMIKLVLYDSRPKSKTKGELMELFIGEDNYCLVKIPPQIWNGYKCIGTKECLLANCPDLPHDPDEMERKDPFTKDIPYDWALKNR